ncbi:glycosyl transferase family 2 [Candidatus Pacearchaeota archaeon CG10_big_fil_rev_8_21_14_0_10_31_24]|nr:MAG: glycosyl transferase family 2 [Candidatus Pacearchaeota archaeon CG10_big_fil_rev_8_21_14_0_10_31_24]
MTSVSIITPALNEEEGIFETIKCMPVKQLEALGYEVEVLVVDGGSKDKTVEIARKAGARVISGPRGYGRQYRFGFAHAKGEVIVTGDSDGTYPFEDSVYYIKYLEKHKYEFINVNRFARMESGAMHLSNKIGNFGLTFFTDLLFGLRLKDSQSGMWIFKKSILKKLKLVGTGMPLSQELKIEAFRKVRSIELGGRYKKRLGDTKLLRIKDGFGNLWALFEKRFRQ